jgi:hypothetical protein
MFGNKSGRTGRQLRFDELSIRVEQRRDVRIDKLKRSRYVELEVNQHVRSTTKVML